MSAELPPELFDGDDWYAESPTDPHRSANVSPCICDACFSDDDEAERSYDHWQVSVDSDDPGELARVVTREHRSREEVPAAFVELGFDPTGCEWVQAGDPGSPDPDFLKPSTN